jgi:hypothetical protein
MESCQPIKRFRDKKKKKTIIIPYMYLKTGAKIEGIKGSNTESFLCLWFRAS